MRLPLNKMLALAGGLVGFAPLHAQDVAVAFDVHGLWQEHDRLAGGGPGYRVEFDSGHTTYVPALPAATRTLPVRFELESIRRGTRPVRFPESVSPSSESSRVEYVRGPVIERYTLSSDGIEQSFVIPSRIEGAGELVVRQRIDTELATDVRGDCSDGLTLLAPDGSGGVSIGRAIAIDADGVERRLTMTFDGEHLEIRAPDALLESASYPLVLDPPIGTVISLSSRNGDVDPDAAWDETTQRYLVAWSRRLSAVESEIVGTQLDAAGTPIGSLLGIRTGAGVVAANPTVANVDVRDRFCVFWQEGASPFGPFDIKCLSVEATSGARSGVVHVGASTESNVDPDAANAVGPRSSALVVWTRVGVGIHAAAVSLPATGDPRATSERAIRLDADAEQPAITKSIRMPAAIWKRGSAIEAVALTTTGFPTGAIASLGSSSTTPRGNPDIDGDGRGNYFAVYESKEFLGQTKDIIGRPLAFDGTDLVPGSEVVIERTRGEDEITPAVGFMAGKYLVAFADANGGFLDYDLVLQAFAPDGMPCGARSVARTRSAFADSHPEITTQFGAGGRGDEALAVFSSVSNRGFGTSVHAQLFEAFVGDGTIRRLGGDCGGGGTIDTSGPPAVGNIFYGYELNGASVPDGAAALVIALPGSPTLNCGTCSILPPLVAFATTLQNGSASVPLPLSCSLEPAVGTAIVAQWIMIGSSTSPCQLIPGLAASERLEATLGR